MIANAPQLEDKKFHVRNFWLAIGTDKNSIILVFANIARGIKNMSSSEHLDAEYLGIVTTLKSMLKKRRLRYRDVAEKTGLPESTLKKIFSGRDCSIRTLMRICECMDTSLEHVLKVDAAQLNKGFSLTDDQEQLFVREPEIYDVFIRLLQKKEKDQIRAGLGLEQTTLDRYYRELEEVKLLERHPGGKAKLLVEGALKVGEGPLHDFLVGRVSERFMKALPQLHKHDKDTVYEVGSIRITRRLFEEFSSSLVALYRDFDRRSNLESTLLEDKDLNKVTYIIAAAEFDSIKGT